MARPLSLLAAAATLLLGCGAVPPATAPDALPDAGAVPDTAPDTAPDATPDATREDAAVDAGLDVTADAPIDTPIDTPSDIPSDIPSDTPADAAGDVAPDRPDAADPSLVAVAHAREFRAAWVATVTNINFPSRAGLTAATQRAELTATLDAMARTGLNAVVFQVRPEGDAVYRSSLEPWSRFLTGRQGGDPGYDPLEFLVAEAHRRGIEVHAWFNPFRAKVTATTTAVAPHISVTHPAAVVPYDGHLWMDPGDTVVHDRAVAVISDVVRRYAVDGVHFDDYFYPYPDGTDFPDARTYEAWRASGGRLGRADWRRDNVNRFVRRVSETVASLRADARFGISPFGIYRPGMPAGITGLDPYNAIYADSLRWLREGWVDYLAPQLYWPTTQTAQAYGPLIRWWAESTTGGRYIFAGNYLSRLGSSAAWSLDELRAQVTLTRAQRARGAMGNIYFTVAPFQSNRLGVADAFRREFYARPALTPPLVTAPRAPVAPPAVRVEGRTLRVSHPSAASLRAWAVYRWLDGRWQIERVVPSAVTAIDVVTGRWAVSAASRFGVESLGAVADVR